MLSIWRDVISLGYFLSVTAYFTFSLLVPIENVSQTAIKTPYLQNTESVRALKLTRSRRRYMEDMRRMEMRGKDWKRWKTREKVRNNGNRKAK